MPEREKLKIYGQNDIPDEHLGGKAEGLYYLKSLGLTVPEFYVIPNETLQLVLKGEISYQDLVDSWQKKYSPETDSLWSFRSSAEVEDGKEKSYAGIFTSVMNCGLEQMSDALEQVLEGFEKAKETNYHEGEDFGYNVVIQKMISADYSGVGFSINPMNYESDNPLVNIIPGMGVKLVSGEENALVFEIDDHNKPMVLSHEMSFVGQKFASGEYISSSVESSQIVGDLDPLYKELRDQLLLFEKDKGYPVDTEFAIVDGKIFWLQIRPVTNYIPKGKYIVWDNSNSAVNYPGIVMPLTSSFVLYSYSNAYKTMFRFLGAGDKFIAQNEVYFSNMQKSINGAVYYNITAWQTILYQMPFGKRTSKLIARTFGAEEAKFEKPKNRASKLILFRLTGRLLYSIFFFNKLKKRYLEEYHRVQDSYGRESFEGLSHSELIAKFRMLEKELGKEWYPPMINGFFTMISYNGLRKVLSRSRLSEKYPNFLNDALTGNGDVISVIIVRSLQQLLANIYANTKASEIVTESSESETLNTLKSECPDIYREIINYLNDFGERCDEGELKIETVNYSEDPVKFIQFLKSNLQYAATSETKENIVGFEKIIDQEYRYNPLKKWLLKKLVRFTIRRVKDRENFRFIRTRTFNITRRMFRAMDKELLGKGLIAEVNDSLYLEFNELMDPEHSGEYKEIISARKKEYANYDEDNIPSRYYEVGGKFYPASVNIYSNNGDELKGLGCSSGVRTGEVVVVTKDNLHEIEVEGKILVATFFEPGWIGLFARCKGLISERGSLLSHTSILCREMNIPAIVGAKNILNRLTDGDTITMNGSTGKIEKTDHE